MPSFIGRYGHQALFSDNTQAVVVDSRVGVVTATGSFSDLASSRPWEDGEYSESDVQAAEFALESLRHEIPQETGRLYTIPRGVQRTAQAALEASSSASHAAYATARLLASGGQIDFNRLVNITHRLEQHQHEAQSESWNLYGGNAAYKWATAIVSKEPLTADAGDITDIFTKTDGDVGPEFVVRISTLGSGIDRLYRIDIDGRVYVWDDNNWDDLGHVDWNIWDYDEELDGGTPREDVTHILIDPESAIYIAAHLQYGPVFVEDIDLNESEMVRDAVDDLDWELLDSTITAAAFEEFTSAAVNGGTEGDGVYTPAERSENASKQVRDSNGRFAKQGARVQVGGTGATGTITQVNPQNSTVEVKLDNGTTQILPGNQVAAVDPGTVNIPGKPASLPRVDFSGILAEPRTPINRTQGTIPGTLPAMTTDDLHNLINNFPAWVKAQRESFVPAKGMAPVSVQAPNSTSTGKEGQYVKDVLGHDLTLNAYDHPLLQEWFKQRSRSGISNTAWYLPLHADAGEPEADQSGAQELTPETSDVQPLYMAVVSPDDPRAVFSLICLVPASSSSVSPMVYTRQDGQWVRDEQTLNDLRSPTPPPVVPLNSDTLNDVLTQVDESQHKDDSSDSVTEEDERVLNEPLPDQSDLPAGAPKPESVVLAGADFDLQVLWGPRKDIMQAAVVAAGGLDRNRGGAEKLRHYWTRGPGAAKILWGTPGDWTRCVRYLGKYMGPRAKGYCSLRHKEMTHMWPGDRANRQTYSLHASGSPEFSTKFVRSSHQVIQASVLRAKAEITREHLLHGITASAMPTYRIYEDARQAVNAITASALADMQIGGEFFIPMALPEGIESGDGRLVEPGAADIRNLPISLLWQFRTAQGHDGSVVVGRIEELRRIPGGIGMGYGHFDVGPWGREAERMIRNGMLRFVSADMDNFMAKVRKGGSSEMDEAASSDEATIEANETRVKKARVMAVTIVAKPAFQEATIEMYPDPVVEDDVFPDGLFMEEPDPVDVPALMAAGYIADAIPVVPPRDWFRDPKLDGPTPLTVTDDGHVFGHIAAWTTPHINPALRGINPPKSRSNYAYFHHGVLRTDDGSDVTVGQLTLVGGHAALEASANEAVKHYDDTGSAVADVHAGEDGFGIWVAGALRPGVTAEQVRAFRASAPSGDWRPIRGSLELVAVCQVNVPGFPTARAFVASGHMMALVAAGSAPLMKLRHDPITDLTARLEALESITEQELSAQADEVHRRFELAMNERNAGLNASAEAVFARMESFGYVSQRSRKAAAEKGEALPDGSYPIRNVSDLKNAIRAYGRAKESDRAKVKRHIMKRARTLGRSDLIPDNWKSSSASMAASVESMRSRLGEFAGNIESHVDDQGDVKYTPGHQPRDYQGQFRDILARLKNNLGESENTEIANEINQKAKRIVAGNYADAIKGALDLKNLLDGLDDGSLDSHDIKNVRQSARDLGTVIANLPLPFTNQAAKVRFTDLPPVLRNLMQDFVERVQKKVPDDPDVVKPLQDFMRGGNMLNQSEIDKQMSTLLRLLT